MFLKLGIIGVILIVGGIIFSSEISTLFPNTTSTGVDSLKTDVKTLATDSADTVNKKIESTVDKAETELTEFGQKSIQSAEETLESSVDKVETKFSEIQNDSEEYLEENITENIPFIDS